MDRAKAITSKIRLPARASMWYAASAVITKGISMLSTPVFTRLLSPEEYAIFPLFLSWLGILGALTSADPSSAALLGGIDKFESDKQGFIKASIGFNVSILLTVCALYFTFSGFFGNFTGLPQILMLILFLQLFFDLITHHILALWRFSYRGAPVLILNGATALMTFIIGAALVGIGGAARVLGLLFASGGAALFFLGKAIGFRGSFFDKRAWKYLAASALPLIPQLLASAAVTVTDKLMIRAYFGNAALGKYSVAHSLGISVSFISAALGYALRPWILRKLGKGERGEIKKSCDSAISLLALASLLLIAVSPELLRLLAPSSYSDALFAVLPTALSVLPAFASGIVTVGFIHAGKSRLGILPSLTALIVNVSANALLFRYFPYTSAAVSALISSLICFILGYVLYYFKEKKSLFSISRATAYFIASLFFGTLLFISRELLVLRIILFLLICVLALPSLNVALSLIKEGDSKGQKGEIRS